jgi:transketolase
MRKQFAKTMFELGVDERLLIFIGDISHYLLRDFEEKYPQRFYNMGVAEQAMMSMAAGLAIGGFTPVVHSIAPFVTERCFEQIKDDICYQKLGVKIVSVGSCFDYASLGCTHHCYDDIAILRSLPNMQVVYPSAPHEFDALFRETFANGSPTYFRLPARTHNLETHPRFGEVEKLKSGNDVTMIAIGPQIQNAYDAASALLQDGITCDLIYLSTIKPISEASQKVIRESLSRTGALVTAEEHSIIGGIADAIAAIGRGITYLEERLGVRDKFLTNYGTYEEHCEANNLTKSGIMEAVYKIRKLNK